MSDHIPLFPRPRCSDFDVSESSTDGDSREIDAPGANLEHALDDLMREVRDTTSVSTTIQFDEWTPIADAEKARHIYAIVREGVQRALQRASGEHIVLSLAGRGEEREVSIRDDAPTAVREDDLGGMADAALLLRGILASEPRRSRGSALRLTFLDERHSS